MSLHCRCLFLFVSVCLDALLLPACRHEVDFCGSSSVGLSGVVSLVCLSGCSRVTLSSVCVCSPVSLGFSCWWVPPSSGLTGSHNSCLILYAVVQVLLNETVLPDNQTCTSKKNPPTTSAISTVIEQRLINMKRDYEYCKIGQREYEMTKTEQCF